MKYFVIQDLYRRGRKIEASKVTRRRRPIGRGTTPCPLSPHSQTKISGPAKSRQAQLMEA
jgi:hypothetical protein